MATYFLTDSFWNCTITQGAEHADLLSIGPLFYMVGQIAAPRSSVAKLEITWHANKEWQYWVTFANGRIWKQTWRPQGTVETSYSRIDGNDFFLLWEHRVIAALGNLFLEAVITWPSITLISIVPV